MPDFGDNDPLSVAVRGRGNLYALDTATQPGQGALDVRAPNLINQAVDARSQLEAQRQTLISQLPYADHRQAKAIAAGIQGINAQHHQLDFEDNQRRMEAHDARVAAHDQSEAAARMLKLDREHSIDEQGAQLMTGLGKLDALHRNGNITPDQYDAGLLDLGQQYGLGLRHPDAGKMYEHFVGEADRRNQFNLRRTAAEAARVGARYGVDVQLGEDGLPSIEATKAAALQTPKGKSEFLTQMNKELYEKYGNPLGVSSLFNPIAPHTSPDEGKTINLPFHDKKDGKLAALNVPMETFNKMKADFQDRYFSAFPPQEATAQTGPEVGTQRTIGGVAAVWDGSGWKKAQ